MGDPAFDAPRTGAQIEPGEAFLVSEDEAGVWGEVDVTFLRLADGRGWAFDRKPGLCILAIEEKALIVMQKWARGFLARSRKSKSLPTKAVLIDNGKLQTQAIGTFCSNGKHVEDQ